LGQLANEINRLIDLTCSVTYGHAMPGPRVVSLKKRATTSVTAPARTAAPSQGVKPEVAASPLFGVAMLKIAMELKKADARPLDELIKGVLTKMRLDEADFRSFLEANGGLLRTIAQGRGY
jgi:hypothetical protein